MLYLFYYCLCLLFNKIRDKGRTREQGMAGEMAQTLYAHMNKQEKK
jgi:hypothetical protein